jgi:putative PEP-CTERM system TPR-repeat lipoprotein
VKRRCRITYLLSLLLLSAPGFDNAAYGASRAESAITSAAAGKCDEAAVEAAAVPEQEPGAVEACIAAARCYAKQNKPAEAVPLLEKALAVNAENEDAVTGLAAALLQTGEHDKAKGLLTGLLDKKPASDEALTLLVFLAEQDGDAATAENYLKKRLDQDPDNDNLLFRLGDFYLGSGTPDKAVALLEARLERKPDAQAVRSRLAGLLASSGKSEQALALLDKAPKQDGDIKLVRAGILLRVGRLDEGESTLKALLDDPRDKAQADEARIGLTELYMQTGRAGEAEKQADALITANPGRPEGYLIRGRIRYAEKNFAGAADDFETVVKAVPDDYRTALSLAEARNAAGNTQAAENAVTRVLSNAPQYAPAYLTLADIYLTRNMPDAALMILDMGRKAVPDDTSIPMAASAVLSQLQRYGDAVKMLEQPAENKNPQVAETALLRIAALYTAQKNIAKAVAAYDRLLALNPASTIAAEGRIRAQIGAKQQKAALVFAEKRQKDRPDDAAAAFMVGECAVAAGDAQKAEKSYLRALDLAPSWEQPLLMLVRIYGATKRADKAVKLCSDLYAAHPDNLNAAMYAAMILEQTGKFSEAETRYRKLIADKPEYLAAANNLAFLLTRHKPTPERLEEAEELAGKAAAGGASQPLDTLGWVRMLRGNAAGAEETLRGALAAKQDNTFARYHLAEVLAASGDEEKKKEAEELLKAPAADKAFPLRADAEKLLKRLRGAAPAAAAQAKPAQAKPAQAKPAQSKPARNKPAQSKPARNKPASGKGAASAG